MKKIGILFGQENTFPQAFVERVNRSCATGICAEFVMIDKALQGEPESYAVIIDRISHDVPFYRAWLKNAALEGAAVINNPFWWSADEKYFNNALALSLQIPVPNTALLPSFEQPADTMRAPSATVRYPLDWEAILFKGRLPRLHETLCRRRLEACLPRHGPGTVLQTACGNKAGSDDAAGRDRV